MLREAPHLDREVVVAAVPRQQHVRVPGEGHLLDAVALALLVLRRARPAAHVALRLADARPQRLDRPAHRRPVAHLRRDSIAHLIPPYQDTTGPYNG